MKAIDVYSIEWTATATATVSTTYDNERREEKKNVAYLNCEINAR